MSDPPRFLSDPSATPFERDLLESWSSEQPSAAARARALALTGVAAGALAAAASAASSSAAAAASTTGTGAAGVAAPSAAAAGLAASAKWAILGVLVVASGVASVAAFESTRTSSRASAGASSSSSSPAMAVPAAPTAEPPTVSPADLPPASPPAAVTTSAAVPAVPPPGAHARGADPGPGESSLSAEIATFDRARAALDAGDSDRALGLLDAYETRFPTGTFVQEAEVLRVQALARKGDDAGARRVGQRFLAAHPQSPHAARIRAILDSSNR